MCLGNYNSERFYLKFHEIIILFIKIYLDSLYMNIIQ